jgi:cell division septation protein DedD
MTDPGATDGPSDPDDEEATSPGHRFQGRHGIMHILSLVLGIFGVILIFVPVVNLIFAPMLAASALITGAISRTLVRVRENDDDRRIATAGLALGGVGILLSLMLYGACAWVIDKATEPGPKLFSSRKDKDLEKKMETMESKLREDMARLGERIDKRMEGIEKRLPPGPPAPGGGKGDDVEKYLDEIAKKKEEMKQELKQWEDWLETMPLLEKKAAAPPPGGVKPSPVEKLEAVSPPPPTKKPAKAADAEKAPKPKPKPKVQIKSMDAPDAKEYELLSPYEYF